MAKHIGHPENMLIVYPINNLNFSLRDIVLNVIFETLIRCKFMKRDIFNILKNENQHKSYNNEEHYNFGNKFLIISFFN